MKDKILRLVNDGLVYGLAFSLQSLLSIILLPILTDYYSPDLYGVYNIIILVSGILSTIFYFGASSALGRYYYDEDSDFYRTQIISATFFITLFGAIILILIGYFFSDLISLKLFNSIEFSNPIFLSFTATSFNFLVGVFSLLVRYLKKPLFFLIIIIFGTLLNFIVTYVLLEYYNYGIEAPIIGQLVANILLFAALFVKYIRLLTVKINNIFLHKIFKFGIPIAFSSLIYFFVDGVDRFLIKELLDIRQVGIYALVYSLGRVINVFLVSPFAMVWAPLRMEYFNKTDDSSFRGLNTLVTSYYTILGVFIIFFLTLFGENLLKLFFSNESYYEGFKILPIILFSFFLHGYQNILDFGIYQNNKTKFYLYISTFSLILNVTLNLWLIPKYGIFAAACTTLTTYLFNIFILYQISNFYYKVSYEISRVFFPIFILVITFCIITLYNVSIIYKFSIFILFILWIYNFWLLSKEKNVLINLFKSVTNK